MGDGRKMDEGWNVLMSLCEERERMGRWMDCIIYIHSSA